MIARIGLAIIALGVALQCGALSLVPAILRAPRRRDVQPFLVAFAIGTAVLFLGSTLVGLAVAFH
jgi:hypothetical protein